MKKKHWPETYKSTMAVIALALTPLSGAAMAGSSDAAQVKIGTLTCVSEGSVGLLIGSTDTLECTFKQGSGAPTHRYVGTISKVGLDVGIKGKSVLVWGVLASSSALPSEALTGVYNGVAADAALGLGAGAQVLVGGSSDSIVLQPVSVSGQVGLNVAVGVAQLRLDAR